MRRKTIVHFVVEKEPLIASTAGDTGNLHVTSAEVTVGNGKYATAITVMLRCPTVQLKNVIIAKVKAGNGIHVIIPTAMVDRCIVIFAAVQVKKHAEPATEREINKIADRIVKHFEKKE